jgi:hypothetical protein
MKLWKAYLKYIYESNSMIRHNTRLFDKVKQLNLPKGKYAIFGSGPICTRGLRSCKDIDIIATKDLFDKLRKDSENWTMYKSDLGSDFIVNKSENIEIGSEWKPGKWDIPNLIKTADIIHDLPFVKLDYVLKWKKILKREKDLDDIKIISDYLTKK